MQPRGSSPLTRGKQRLLGNRTDRPRLIPAHAGKTAFCMASMRREPAHPRSRGENGYTPGRDIYHFGSSPLTRGKQRHCLDNVVVGGLIPAHAGKTLTRRASHDRQRAHPRSRGENSMSEARIHTRSGSSPLTRGKHTLVVVDEDGQRLIPAHAGKTYCEMSSYRSCAAHPRSRGENGRMLSRHMLIIGSSPLTRGKPYSFRCST